MVFIMSCVIFKIDSSDFLGSVEFFLQLWGVREQKSLRAADIYHRCHLQRINTFEFRRRIKTTLTWFAS